MNRKTALVLAVFGLVFSGCGSDNAGFSANGDADVGRSDDIELRDQNGDGDAIPDAEDTFLDAADSGQKDNDDEPAGECPLMPYGYRVGDTCVESAIRVELRWHTPGDPDEQDTGPATGTDLNLHFLHPWADGPDMDRDGKADGWYDIPFDCFWYNAYPNWGSDDPAVKDDPWLEVDDTDGAGPETIILAIPEDGATYRVGVIYWNDHGFGPSTADVRVYINGEVKFARLGVVLQDSDLWEVATIEWPSATVKAVEGEDGGLKITHQYKNPYFFQ